MFCIKNATIHDGKEHVFKKDILIDGHTIVSVSEHIDTESEYFDAQGMHVFPGFIDPMSNWGILGPGREIRGNAEDNDEHTQVCTPEMNIIYAFNGRGIRIQQLGAFGITAVGVAPSNNNLFGGMMGVFDVDGINPFKMCIKEKAGLKACVTSDVTKFWGAKNMMPSTHMGIFQMFNEQLRNAKEYDSSKGRDPKKEAIREMLDKKMPLFVVAKKPMEVHSLLHILKDYDVDLVLASGFGLQDCEEEILEYRPAIISSVRVDGFNTDAADGDNEFLYQLYKKGIQVSLASNVDGRMCSREEMLWNGIDMYKACHDSEAVITMMTFNNAKALGVDDITGSIEEGKRADLIIYSDHPLKTYKAEILLTLSNGKAVYRKGDEMKCFI